MSQFISLEDAVDMTTLYRQDKETILSSTYQNHNILPKCETFERDYFDDVLAQSGCVGIRIYYGMDENNKVHAIVVGVNGDDEDIIFPNTDNSLIIEEAKRCPDDCPPSSDLNS
jgi:hypothetical protein